jgi:hypothetical protein
MGSPRIKVRQRAIKAGFRSGLEQDNAKLLDAMGVSYEYETLKIPFVPKPRTYTPDFVLPNGIIVETKGRFVSSDRTKHLLVKDQHPHLDIRFVFSNPNTKISKRSKSTYGSWCDQYGFQYATGMIPRGWTRERKKL